MFCLVFGAEIFLHEQQWNLSGQGTFAERQTLFLRNRILVVALERENENKNTFFYSEVEPFSLGGVLAHTVKFFIYFILLYICEQQQ